LKTHHRSGKTNTRTLAARILSRLNLVATNYMFTSLPRIGPRRSLHGCSRRRSQESGKNREARRRRLACTAAHLSYRGLRVDPLVDQVRAPVAVQDGPSFLAQMLLGKVSCKLRRRNDRCGTQQRSARALRSSIAIGVQSFCSAEMSQGINVSSPPRRGCRCSGVETQSRRGVPRKLPKSGSKIPLHPCGVRGMSARIHFA
jgi:hypothetical protein